MNVQSARTIFFGSTDDSVIVLERLSAQPVVTLVAVITQPAKPVGRDRTLTPTPVESWAKKHGITVLSFPNDPDKPWLYENQERVIDALQPLTADLIISASYGQKIPSDTIRAAKFGGINIHPSILPRWRGGDPVPWAIMTGDRQAGVTVVSLSEKFDEGLIYAQEKIPIGTHDTSDPLRTKLFGIGAELLCRILPDYIAGKCKGKPQKKSDEPRATRLSRETGFVPWESMQSAMSDPDQAAVMDRKLRALHPWPGIWTLLPLSAHGTKQEKRLKILEAHCDTGLWVPDLVQLEGKQPVSWGQFSTAYLTAA